MDKFLVRKDVFNQLSKSFMLNAETIEKARDRSRLMPKKITDKNGHQKTVYVRGTVEEKGMKQKKVEEPTESKFKVGETVNIKGKNGNFTINGIDKDNSLHVSNDKKESYHVSTNYVSQKDESGNNGSGENKSDKLPVYVNQLSTEQQEKLKNAIKQNLQENGLSGSDLEDAIENAMDSKINDLSDTVDVKSVLSNSSNNISGSTHTEGDIVQFKDSMGKKHNGKVLMVGKENVTIMDNNTKVNYDVKHEDIKVLAKVNDKDEIRNFYDASGVKPTWRDGTNGLQPESSDTIEGLLKNAADVQKEFSKLSDKRQDFFKSELGIDTLLLKRPELKSVARIQEKLKEDAMAEKEEAVRKQIYDVDTDTYHCRTIRDTDGHTFTCNSIEEVSRLFSYFKNQPDIIRMKNNFANPSDVGYSDINMNIRLSNGSIAEIQLNTTANIVAKERYGHSLYEVWRSIKSNPKYKNLADTMADAQKKLYGLSNKDSKNGTFPKIQKDQVYAKDFKHKPYADAIRDSVAKAIPDFEKARKEGVLNDKTVEHFRNLIEYIK